MMEETLKVAGRDGLKDQDCRGWKVNEERGGDNMQIQKQRKDIFEGICDLFCKIEDKSICRQYQRQRIDGLKLNIQKTKIMASSPITSWQIDGEIVETVADFILGGSKITVQIVTAAMKLKDICSLEEKV